jgi:acyl-CoA reductase-like NAD-dependent aldehyde dehydrogenase
MISTIADAAERWRNPGFPPRVRAAQRISERLAYGMPMVEFALDSLFGAITAENLASVIASETGDLVTEPIGRVAIISSRTTIGVAIVPAIFAIAAGCEVLVKDREDHLVAKFFATLRQAQDDTGCPSTTRLRRYAQDDRGFRAEPWEGASRAQDLSRFDAVVAFGTNETLDAIRRQLPEQTRFIPYGPKASVGYVARDALRSEEAARQIAAGAARDLLLYEGEGCLSLHALFIESGAAVSPESFAALLSDAIERAAIEFPLHPARAHDAVTRMNARDLAAFRGTLLASDRAASYVLEAGSANRPPAFLPRVLPIHTVASREEMRAYLERHGIAIELCAGEDGVSFGQMQRPPLQYRHGGRPRIAEFLRAAEFAT